MDYEKKYKEALERAKEKYTKCYSPALLDYIFPELKEDDGEKSKKWILEYLYDGLRKSDEQFKGHFKTAIAWLEKQGEQRQDVNVQINPSEYINNIGGNGCYLKNATQTSTCSKKEEKVDNQNCVKSVDDIKPKFKVGDWVVFDNGNVEHITSVGTHGYTFDDGDYLLHDKCDKDARLWNIADAKDGDVLYSSGFHSDCIFIFNRLDNWRFDEPNGERAVATGYCCLTLSADTMDFGIQGPDCIEVNTIKPATKEQRELLFQRMKGAGWEWDSKKKELRKGE